MPTNVGYVLLCRHARHHRGTLLRDEGDDGRPSAYPSEAVAERLREILTVQPTMDLTRVLVAPTDEARGTARVLQDCLAGDAPWWSTKAAAVPQRVDTTSRMIPPRWTVAGSISIVDWQRCDRLLPGATGRRVQCDLDAIEKRIAAELRKGSRGSPRAVALVGHEPQLGLLSTRLHRRWIRWSARAWRRGGVAIRSGEIVCLRVDPRAARLTPSGLPRWRGRLAWQISPGDADAEAAIREKIKSKMDFAKQLSAVVTLVLTVVLGALTNNTIWTGLANACTNLLWTDIPVTGQVAVQVAFVLLLLALGLHLAAMYAYDTLLMPSRFWSSSEKRAPRWLPARPPGSTAWVLNRNMQRTWAWLVQPAVLLTVAALVVMALPLLRLDGVGQGAALVVLLLYGGIVWWFRPVVGSAD